MVLVRTSKWQIHTQSEHYKPYSIMAYLILLMSDINNLESIVPDRSKPLPKPPKKPKKEQEEQTKVVKQP